MDFGTFPTPAAILKKSCLLIGDKSDGKWFSVIQNGCRQPFRDKNGRVAILNAKMTNGRYLILLKLYWSEIASNAIKSYFRSLANLEKVMRGPKMTRNVIFMHPQWPVY